MESIRATALRLTTPKNSSDPQAIEYWQERILLSLLFVCVVLGFVVYLPSVGLSIKEGLYTIAVGDTVIYLCVLVLLFHPTISYGARAVTFCGISHLLGLVLLFVLGPFGAGPVWLFAFPVLTALFLGFKSGMIALGINALTIVGVGLLVMSDLLGWGAETINPHQKWIVTSLNFLLLNIVVVLSVSSVLKGLYHSLDRVARSEQKYRQIFENIQDVYYEENLDQGTIEEISPSIEKISSYTRQELLGKPSHLFYEKPETRKSLVQEISTRGQLTDYHIHLKDRDGSVHVCSVNAALVEKDQDGGASVVGIFRDITRQTEMEEENQALQGQLERAKKMEALGLLAGGVAHDLNNVLSGIVGYPEVLLLDLDRDSPLTAPLKAMQASGQKAAAIVQDLLTLSRRGVATMAVVNLNDLVLDFMETLEYARIIEHNPHSRVEKALDANHPFIMGSRVHLSKTVMNLLANAAEAQTRGGEIRISTGNLTVTSPINGYTRVEPGEYVILAVADQGSGIALEDMERIFEPFFTKKVMGRSGTGLGMAVVWGTVQDHGGSIDVRSSPGSGTTFTLYFPVTRERAFEPQVSGSFEDYSGRRQHVLVVDDVLEQREMAAVMLAKLNYRVSSVKSGEAALAFVQKTPVDLLILDMIMDPGMDGLETYEKILALHPGQRAVIASGFSETDRVRQAMALGVCQYVKKPYGMKEIGRAVQKALQ
ncbi:MAG: ATP-binding protein [Desulfobacteraceae bacterium]